MLIESRDLTGCCWHHTLGYPWYPSSWPQTQAGTKAIKFFFLNYTSTWILARCTFFSLFWKRRLCKIRGDSSWKQRIGGISLFLNCWGPWRKPHLSWYSQTEWSTAFECPDPPLSLVVHRVAQCELLWEKLERCISICKAWETFKR